MMKLWTAEWRIKWGMIIAVIYTQFLQLRKESLKKIQACTGFEPLSSTILVQRFTN